MDEIVAQALRKWPNVPAVYGWLSLDRRGNWAIKGERIANPLITQFIARNYSADGQGRWFFQNGPQRVFVRLDYTPLVYRTHSRQGELTFAAHTGRNATRVQRVWLDERGGLLLETELGIGVAHDQDLPEVLSHLLGPDGAPLADEGLEHLLDEAAGADAGTMAQLESSSGLAPLYTILAEEVARRFGFDPDPHPAPGEPEC